MAQKQEAKIDKIITAIRNKKVYHRALVLIILLGMIAYLILSDHSCKSGDKEYKSNSKVGNLLGGKLPE